MPMAAVPNYLGTDFKHASPGMRFGMYFKLWEAGWSKSKDRPLDDAKRVSPNDLKTMKALLARQQQTFDASAAPAASLRLAALAIAPFTTGLGNEHPLENGFAFLNPYGLPYLPGSGVKGVLRQAARELASGQWGEKKGWSDEQRYYIEIGVGKERRKIALSMLDALFGRETETGDTDHVRGALTFWDVIPQIAPENPKSPDQISLAVEIMTPHQSHYYQQDAYAGSMTPHESGKPNPISFLTVPPGSDFVFHVQCDAAHLVRLAPELAQVGQDGSPRWKTLLEAAFAHAFKWLGFGAKTAVGYGAMETERMKQARLAEMEKQRQAETQTARARERERQEAEAVCWHGARIKFNRANKSLTAEKDGKTAIALAPRGEMLLASLPADIRTKIEANQFVKLDTYVAGNTLLRVKVNP